MPCSLALPWDDALVGYDFGPGHPLAPIRVELAVALARAFGVLDRPGVRQLDVVPADQALLELVHTPAYIQAVQQAGRTLQADHGHGLGPGDNPVFAGMHEAGALVAGATVGAARALLDGGADHAISIAGGLHHAMPAAASGFCVYNDPAIAIRWLLDQGISRIAYVDIDVHHGDGVQAVFYDDPRVLTVSVHESGRTLFPGTGFPDELGTGDARGCSVNVALPAGTGDDGWLRAIDAVALPVVRAFAPQVLVSQHGCDSHALDPLANLLVSVDGQREAHAMLHRLAHETCGGRWLATGGGGYELVRVVPRSWSHLLAEASGEPIAPQTPTPQDWRELARARTGVTAPALMTDARPAGFRRYQPAGSADDAPAEDAPAEDAPADRPSEVADADPADLAIRTTRELAFPLHGLQP